MPPAGQFTTQPYPGPPELTTRQTTLPPAELKRRLHPAEMPWVIVGVVLSSLAYCFLVFFLVTSLVATITGIGTDDQSGPNLGPVLGPLVNYALSLLGQIVAAAALAPLLILLIRGLNYAQQRANGVRMSPTQFPEGYRMVVEAALAAGLRKVPDAYVVSGGGTINAFASGHGHRRFVVVYSDLFEVGGAARDPDALRFVIGHEVGHLAAGHVSYFRLVFTSTIRTIPVLGKFLSRAQEYTADNFGYHYCPQGARGAIKVLSGGKYLNANVDFDEFTDRALTERGFFLWVTNLNSTHPILVWRAQALRNRAVAGSMFLPPKGQPGIPSLPPGSDPTTAYPAPAEALAFLDAFPPTGPSQFGAVFPTPLPGEEGRRPADSQYGRRTLFSGWERAGRPGMGPGGPAAPGFPGGPGSPIGPGAPGGPGFPGGGGHGGPPPPSGWGGHLQAPAAGYPQSQPSAGYPQSQPSAGYPQSQPSAGHPQSQPSAGYPQSQPSAGYPQSQPSAEYPPQGPGYTGQAGDDATHLAPPPSAGAGQGARQDTSGGHQGWDGQPQHPGAQYPPEPPQTDPGHQAVAPQSYDTERAPAQGSWSAAEPPPAPQQWSAPESTGVPDQQVRPAYRPDEESWPTQQHWAVPEQPEAAGHQPWSQPWAPDPSDGRTTGWPDQQSDPGAGQDAYPPRRED